MLFFSHGLLSAFFHAEVIVEIVRADPTRACDAHKSVITRRFTLVVVITYEPNIVVIVTRFRIFFLRSVPHCRPAEKRAKTLLFYAPPVMVRTADSIFK